MTAVKTKKHIFPIEWIEDNAKLIAAAPELLETLKDLIEDIKGWENYNRDQIESFRGNEAEMQKDIADDILKRMNKAKAAIKKATQ